MTERGIIQLGYFYRHVLFDNRVAGLHKDFQGLHAFNLMTPVRKEKLRKMHDKIDYAS